jgi:hypothetical protein
VGFTHKKLEYLLPVEVYEAIGMCFY